MFETTREDVKKFLSSYETLKQKENLLAETLEEINESMTTLQAMTYDRVKVKGNTNTDRLARVIDKRDKLLEEYENTTIEKYRKKFEIISFINRLDNTNRDCDILIDKYINGLDMVALKKKYRYEKDVLYNKISLACKRLANIKT